MRTRSSSNFPVVSSNPSTSKHRNRRRLQQPFILEESPIDTMADQRTMAELLRAPTEGYAKEIVDRYIDLLRACPHHGFTELHQLDTFYNALNPADYDFLNAAAGGNLLEIRTQDVLTIIENKSKIAKLTHAVNHQTSAVTTAMAAILKQFQATPPPASVKVVEETCVTCGGAHPYYQCLAASGNTFPELRDNVQGYVSAAAVNYNQGNLGFRPLGIANQIRPPEETFTDPNLAEYTIKAPPHPVQKYKPQSQIEYVVHQRDPLYPNIPYPSRMLKQKQQEKDEVQIHKFWQMFKQLHINITLVDALILMPKYQKMLKALLSNKEKLQELANTPLNENCSAIILKKLPKKLGDPRKFLIPYRFSELKRKALADLGASINLMPLSVWNKLCLPELISTRMTLELANRAICTPAEIARDVFVPVGKFTFLADFVIVDYESDPKVPFILGRPFLRTARALIDVHGEEMVLRDGDERLILNMRHDTSSYSNQPRRESIYLINVFNNLSEYFLEDLFSNQPSGNPTFLSHPKLTSPKVNDDIFDSEGRNVLSERLLDLDSTKYIHPPLHDDTLSGSTTFSSNPLLEEFAGELTFPPKYDDDLQFDIEFDLKEIEFMLYQGIDSSLKDSIDLANPADNVVDYVPDMFTDEHALDYSSHPIFDEYDDNFLEIESDAENVYDDPFDSKGEKIEVSKLLIDELDLPFDFLLSEYDSFISQDFSRVDALPSTNNEDKIFNLGFLIQEKSFEIITRVVQDKKLASSNASSMLEDFDPPFYEPLFFKKVPSSKMLLSFSSKNEEKVFKPGGGDEASELLTKEAQEAHCVKAVNRVPSIKSKLKDTGKSNSSIKSKLKDTGKCNSPKSRWVSTSERVFSPQPVTQYNPITGEVRKEIEKSAVDDNPKVSKVSDESNMSAVVAPVIDNVPVATETDKETEPVVESAVEKHNPKVTSNVSDDSVKECVKVPVVRKSVKASSVVTDKLSSENQDKIDLVANKRSSLVADKFDVVVKKSVKVSSLVTDKFDVVKDKVDVVADKASDALKSKLNGKGKKPVVGKDKDKPKNIAPDVVKEKFKPNPKQKQQENPEVKAKVNVKRKMILSKEDDRKKKLKGKLKKDASDSELETDVIDYSFDEADRKRKKLKIKAGLKRKRSGSDSSDSSEIDTKSIKLVISKLEKKVKKQESDEDSV
nr:reverse transcriptase domain-containing protein [Tanacetum cinerariifolium]